MPPVLLMRTAFCVVGMEAIVRICLVVSGVLCCTCKWDEMVVQIRRLELYASIRDGGILIENIE